ncbi:MAG: O-acetyl-ADP-ribose deacetylase [Candidatus Eisenbacteria bacterium]
MTGSLFDRLEIAEGDITRERVAAVVNAANSTLLGGGGVDGAIHRAAGPELRRFCETLGGCETGDAKITPGFRLHAEFVIHTVGPVYHGGKIGEPEALASCYRRSLELAARSDCKSVAFPAISTGAYGYPFEDASRIAILTTVRFLEKHPVPRTVRFVLFGRQDLDAFQKVFDKARAEEAPET